MAKAESTLRMNATPAKVMAVLSDFESYTDFLPEIRGVDVLSREDMVSTVRFDLQLLMKVSYTLVLTQEGETSLEWDLSESKLIKKNTGYWKLKANDDGSTDVTYGIDLELAGKLPASVNQRMAGQALPETLARFKERVEAS
jgi:ribosome-associated toxin RatA of RatAB toxin-antitoxin module